MAQRKGIVHARGAERWAVLRAVFIVAAAAILLLGLPFMTLVFVVALFTSMWQLIDISAIALALASVVTAAGLSAGGE